MKTALSDALDRIKELENKVELLEKSDSSVLAALTKLGDSVKLLQENLKDGRQSKTRPSSG